MDFDLSQFNQRYEFEFESTTLGRLHCRVISLAVLGALEKINKNLAGRPLIVKLLENVAERVPDTEEEGAGVEQEGTPITADEADQLSDDEIEAFAREFLAHNPSLSKTYGGAADKLRAIEKGKRVIPVRPRPIKLLKEPEESELDFLARVVRRELDERIRKLNNITTLSGALKSAGLSVSTQNALRENLLLSDRLGGMAGNLGRAIVPALQTPSVPSIRIPDNPAHETNARLNDVLDHMDEMRPIVAEAANLIRSMNEAAIRMLGDFGRNARRTEIYTLIIIGIAALGLLVTAGFSVQNYFDSLAAAVRSNQLIEQFGTQTQALSEAQDQRAERLLGEFGNQVQSLTEGQHQRTERLIVEFQALLSKQFTEDQSAFVEALTEAVERVQHNAPPANNPPNSDKGTDQESLD